jgi:HEAT repeat protein
VESPDKATPHAFEDQAPRENAARLEQLMRQLNTVTGCDKAAAKLVWCGRPAISALRRFLLEGKPSVIYQPRRAAVEALRGLGAKDALMEYLTLRRDIPDAATRFAEECVKNAAACELAKFRTRDVLDVLLSFALPHSRPGIVEALGEFNSLEAIPYFLRALEDDLCQAPAMDAIRRLGRGAELALLTSARTHLPSREEERPSSVLRRAKSLELLAEIGPSPESWPLLRPLLEDEDPAIIAATARLAITLGDASARHQAAEKLVAVLPKADWFLREQIQMLLIDLYPEAEPPVEQEWAARSRPPEIERVNDSTLRILESVRRKVAEAPLQVRKP